MIKCFSNATLLWDEAEIVMRESLVREISALLFQGWYGLNKAVTFHRIETPILTPTDRLKSHIESGFELINTEHGYLRPETTAGTYEAFDLMFGEKFPKNTLPICLWQVGCSFRDEKNAETMRATKLRLRQFYQLEFQLFCSEGTKAPYLDAAGAILTFLYGGGLNEVSNLDLPHYSTKTIDWFIGDLEVGGLSVRKDWKHGMVFEVAIGLDRLVALKSKFGTIIGEHK